MYDDIILAIILGTVAGFALATISAWVFLRSGREIRFVCGVQHPMLRDVVCTRLIDHTDGLHVAILRGQAGAIETSWREVDDDAPLLDAPVGHA